VYALLPGKSYSLKEYLTAVCLCIGAALYSYNGSKLANSNSSPLLVTHQIQGVLMLLVSVTSDAFAPNLTQYLMSGKLTTEDTVTVEDIIFNTNVMGFVLLGGYMLYQGEVSEAIDLPEFNRMSFITVSTIGLFTAVAVSFYTHIIKR
jgi:drug/metabolite transporter (DMT)-like permease